MDQEHMNRIIRLERCNRRLVLGLMLLSMCTAISITIIFYVIFIHVPKPDASIPEKIEAHALVISNKLGKNACTINATTDGWVDFSFTDIRGHNRLALIMTPSGKPTIMISDPEKPKLLLGYMDGQKEEEVSLKLMDGAKRVVWEVPTTNPSHNQ